MRLYSINENQFRNACNDIGLGNGDFFFALKAFKEQGSYNKWDKYYTFYQKELRELAKDIKGRKTAKYAFERLEQAAEDSWKDEQK